MCTASVHRKIATTGLCNLLFFSSFFLYPFTPSSHAASFCFSLSFYFLMYSLSFSPFFFFVFSAPIVAVSFFIFKFAVYWKMQFISAGIVTGIPPKSCVVEVDAVDGKNIFYLPKGTEFTAVMSPGMIYFVLFFSFFCTSSLLFFHSDCFIRAEFICIYFSFITLISILT
jgi:hypothetical protein